MTMNKIRMWASDRKQKAFERKMKKKYPNWNEETWIGNWEFIWGVKSYDDLSSCDTNIHTMNDIEIYYDHLNNQYSLSIETVYIFESKPAECRYLKDLLNHLEDYMEANHINKGQPRGLFFNQPEVSMTANSIGELYWDFKLYVNGFCSLWEE